MSLWEEDPSLSDQAHAAESSRSRVMSAMNVHEPAFLLGHGRLVGVRRTMDDDDSVVLGE